MIHPASRSPAVRAVPLVAVAVVLLSGCGPSAGSGAGSGSGSTASAPAAAGSAGATAPRSRSGGFRGVSGTISALGSGSFTVAASSGTVTVDYTGSTGFDRTAAGSLGDVTGGSCVAVTEAAGSDPSTGSVDASAVRVSRPVQGTCTTGFGPAGGAGFPRGTGARPSGRPGRPGSGGHGVLVGTVESVSGTGFVVTVRAPGTGSTSSATTTTAVAVSGSTAYSVTTAASASDLAVGECVRAFAAGRPAASSAPSSSSGPLTAAAVTLSVPSGGSCAATNRGSGGGAGGAGAGA